MDNKDEFTLLKVIADIRHKTGVGDRIMLSELADFVGALVQNGQSAIDTNNRLVAVIEQQAVLINRMGGALRYSKFEIRDMLHPEVSQGAIDEITKPINEALAAADNILGGE